MALTYARAASWLLDYVAVSRWSAASAGRRRFNGRAERRVHEIRYASSRTILVVAWVRWVLLTRERLRVYLAARQCVPVTVGNHSAKDYSEYPRNRLTLHVYRGWLTVRRESMSLASCFLPSLSLGSLFCFSTDSPYTPPPSPTAPYCVTYAQIVLAPYENCFLGSILLSPVKGRTTRVSNEPRRSFGTISFFLQSSVICNGRESSKILHRHIGRSTNRSTRYCPCRLQRSRRHFQRLHYFEYHGDRKHPARATRSHSGDRFD